MRDVWFKGGLSSKIRLDEVVEEKTIKWTISDDVWNVTAVTNAPKDSYALGKWEWTVTGDNVNCHKVKGKSDVLEETISKQRQCSSSYNSRRDMIHPIHPSGRLSIQQ